MQRLQKTNTIYLIKLDFFMSKEPKDTPIIDENQLETSPNPEKVNIDEVTPTEIPKRKSGKYTFGDELASARNKSRMKIERISKELNIRQDYLIAIEESNAKELPEPVFTMGFIRSFAKIVRTDAEPIIAQYKHEVLHWHAETSDVATPSVAPPALPHLSIIIGSALAGVAVLYGLWFALNSGSSKTPAKSALKAMAAHSTDKKIDTVAKQGISNDTSSDSLAKTTPPLKTDDKTPVPKVVQQISEPTQKSTSEQTTNNGDKPTILLHSIHNTKTS